MKKTRPGNRINLLCLLHVQKSDNKYCKVELTVRAFMHPSLVCPRMGGGGGILTFSGFQMSNSPPFGLHYKSNSHPSLSVTHPLRPIRDIRPHQNLQTYPVLLPVLRAFAPCKIHLFQLFHHCPRPGGSYPKFPPLGTANYISCRHKFIV